MERAESSSGGRSQQQELHPQLPPGFRFHPTDEELVVHYLRKKAASAPLPVAIIADVDLYKFDPWELPGKASFGAEEWYFFSPRDRKYPNGARPNRAATSGYWKATGTDKPILASGGTQKVGVKKALVFYGGKPPKGVKTNWIMHEYRLSDGVSSSKTTPPGADAASGSKTNDKSSLRLDDWVLCRIYKKNSSGNQRLLSEEAQEKDGDTEDMYKSLPLPLLRHHVAVPRRPTSRVVLQPHNKPDYTTNYGALHLDNDENFFEGLLAVGSIQVNHPSPHDLPPHSFSKPELSMLPGSVGSVLPLKRSLSSATWNEAGAAIMASPGKRVQSCSSDVSGVNHDRETHHTNDDDNNINGCSGGGNEGSPSMMATLLNHLQQQGAPYHHHHSSMIPAIGEGVFRQPYQLHGINWGS
ncbi:hypothetical protein Taro_012566 [Colocasia esculenta]|uniref:NAC domain-containing protein n=1 Tax=Colocasia esculenta TaxID=4460 RepID=A0A843UD55_COLES|nr:hypothetical protein [Colocasia esculenta]